ncbi:hypothetical protein EWM60_00825 [Candidatus Erwinia dacicola]|nr:hypothetical protein [Candidatus Erwinia dacicola]NJD84750.1 hypothetical protein [Candidatus Erwinia dacicola]
MATLIWKTNNLPALRAFAGAQQIKKSPARHSVRHCCKDIDELAFRVIERSYLSKTLLTRRISPRGCPK